VGEDTLRIRVLGSGSAWPIPRLGCDCAQCTSDDARDRRLRPSVLVDGRVLVDAGPDVYHQLRAAGAVPEVVVLTHAHHDHMLGLHELAKLRRPWLHCTKESEAELRRVFPRIDMRVAHMTPGVAIDLGDGLAVQPFDVDHNPHVRTMGLRFAQAGRSFVYIPDLSGPPASKLARGADLLMLDGTTYEGRMSGHISMVQGVEIARQARAARTLFTHVGHRAGLHAELEERLPEGAGIAHDGLEIEV
jgi:phosphoribosyl 1,2-cyclic phosphate phosphodiesterase